MLLPIQHDDGPFWMIVLVVVGLLACTNFEMTWSFLLETTTSAPTKSTTLKNNIPKFRSILPSHNNPSSFLQRQAVLYNRNVNLNEFDFSSQRGWDKFYNDYHGSKLNRNGDNNQGTTTVTPTQNFFEWHASVTNQSILSLIPSDAQSCLLLGCGNSRLSQDLYDMWSNSSTEIRTISCLDYSKSCIEQMQHQFQDKDKNVKISFVQGDARDLSLIYSSNKVFDVMIDKGLIDALMCNEGWDSDATRVIQGATQLLSSNNGIYILVSYKLALPTKVFLKEIHPDLQWEFDISQLSNDSVSVSIGRKTR